MVLKRKRSSSELSSSTSSTFGSSPIRPDSFMDMDTTPIYPSASFFTNPRAQGTAYQPGRTMKRTRNNRPSEDEVHRRTLNLLFSAQQQPSAPSPTTSEASLPETPRRAPQPVQRSLHSFWAISARPTQTPSTSPIRECAPPTSCDDCGSSLSAGNDAMDIDDYGMDADHACTACRKIVCSSCSVSNLGEQRRCLQCARRRDYSSGGRLPLSFSTR
ncbi:hypothetical protein F5X68DRAFT_26046 [Plectosphaerella plurivora]|uniref:Uncharacterized protein n=1 Tax=Plectosphaerella plurivora TaxID=936078 RepID=A0A9P8V6N8_9PEZI|nr:hypothetical protein F5X68DRAFT_26046 [Plectosphaerella plurivora]